MPGPFQRIKEQIAKRFPKVNQPKPGFIAGAEMDALLMDTRRHYPDQPVWEKIPHPRDNYFSINILPVHLPLHEALQPAMKHLQDQMTGDGIGTDQRQMNNLYEERFSHIWVAEVQRWVYQPVGICTFVREKSPDGRAVKWWLTLAWLNPAQRNHQVLRNTVPYFKKWHPGFIVGRDHNIVNRSLKNYPEHLRQSDGQNSTLYAD
ncbi:MAG TPA: hypothetical protein VG733_09920 [Chthoniobacteraceae bacterium]|nr:hypothetical protein [Chthoniobacteraceae bacterium]